MKELLLQLSGYNLWANQLLLDAVCRLTEEQQHQQTTASFPSVHTCVLHMLDAESIWWQRMRLQERIAIPSNSFWGTTREAVQQLLSLDKQWLQWIGQAHDHALEHVFLYQNSKREQFKQPVYQMLMHLFNHNTYHRGQLVNQLRQIGILKIPQTDFIVWSRKK